MKTKLPKSWGTKIAKKDLKEIAFSSGIKEIKGPHYPEDAVLIRTPAEICMKFKPGSKVPKLGAIVTVLGLSGKFLVLEKKKGKVVLLEEVLTP